MIIFVRIIRSSTTNYIQTEDISISCMGSFFLKKLNYATLEKQTKKSHDESLAEHFDIKDLLKHE